MSKKRRKSVKKTTAQKQKELLEKGSILSADYHHSGKTRQIIEMFREGLTDKEIFIKILQDNPNLKETSAETYLRSAKASFREEYILDRKFTIIQHVRRYDKDILHLSKFEPSTSSYFKYQMEKTQAYLDMIKQLQRKEKVLGFHRKTVQLRIKNNVNLNLVKVDKMFDFSELSWQEKLDLYNYVQKSHVDPNEKLVLIPNPKNLLEAQKVEEEKLNVKVEEEAATEFIKHEDDPTDLVPDFSPDSQKIKKDSNIIDVTVEIKKQNKGLDEIKNKLLNNLLD